MYLDKMVCMNGYIYVCKSVDIYISICVCMYVYVYGYMC